MGLPRLKLAAALAVLCTCPASAQFSQLAVTDDGSQVYFATNLRLVSEASQKLPATTAIYRVANGVIVRMTDPAGYNPYPFPDSEGNPQVSGDGSVFSYTYTWACGGNTNCFPPNVRSYLTLEIGHFRRHFRD